MIDLLTSNPNFQRAKRRIGTSLAYTKCSVKYKEAHGRRVVCKGIVMSEDILQFLKNKWD